MAAAAKARGKNMRNWIFGLCGASALLLSACDNMTPEQRTVAGVAGGAAAGLIAAEALNANNNWRLIAALGGAAAGTVVAQNTQNQSCAYARGDGTYYTAPCP
jgi:outer membrane lipoprotein SlyB